MRKRHYALLRNVAALGLFLGAASGCSETDAQGDADAAVQDASSRDAQPELRGDAAPLNIGAPCSGVAACLPGSPICLTLNQVTGEGICTRSCSPDLLISKGYSEDDCPIGSACGQTSSGNFCFKTCIPTLAENTCGAESGLACRPDSAGFLPTGRRAICLLDACATDRDCPVITGDACSSDTVCKEKHGDDAHCRKEDVLQRCAVPGNCTVSGLCGPHGKGKAEARVGDPCESDLDCTNNGFCWIELEVDGLLRRPRGYCAIANCAFPESLPEFDCAGEEQATCHFGFVEGFCHRVCDPEDANSCRRENTDGDKGGDYECYNYERIVYRDGRELSAAPICESARSCAELGPGIVCADLGLNDNTALQMSCRDRASGAAKDSETDKDGVCLDNTASGVF